MCAIGPCSFCTVSYRCVCYREVRYRDLRYRDSERFTLCAIGMLRFLRGALSGSFAIYFVCYRDVRYRDVRYRTVRYRDAPDQSNQGSPYISLPSYRETAPTPLMQNDFPRQNTATTTIQL